MMSKFKISMLAIVVIVIIFATFKIMVSSGNGAGITVRYVGVAGGCTEQNPILVTITNHLPFKMNSYAFKLSAKREGYSSNVRNDSQSRSSDKIISAFGTDNLCWAPPKQDDVGAAYLSLDKYGTVSSAQNAIAEENNKENPTLNWAGEIKNANWEFGYWYSAY